MKGKSHLRVGACTLGAGASAAWGIGLVPWGQPMVAALAAGLFLFGKVAPDLDHAGSAITKSWGPISILYSWALVRPFARLVYRLTATAADRPKPIVHRGFTHTVPGALVAGLLVAWLVQSGPWWAAIGLGLMIGGAARVYDRDWTLPVGLVAGGLAWWSWDLLGVGSWYLGIALAAGCACHAMDDCTTTHGTPLKFPLKDPDTGQRWRRRGTPEWMRYDTGSATETAVVGACIVATLGLAYFVFLDPLVRQLLTKGSL